MNTYEYIEAENKELLEALKLLLEREWQDDEGSESLENARSQAKAAIAKAEEKSLRWNMLEGKS